MKKIILGLVLCISLLSCDDESTKEIKKDRVFGINSDIVIFENHKYIIVRGLGVDSGVGIIHAESCECKNINK